MKHEPVAFDPSARPPAQGAAADEALESLLSRVPPCPDLPATAAELAAVEARALADADAGRVYSHRLVGEWLLTWGQPGRKPFLDWLADRDG